MRHNKYEYDAFISHAVEDKIPIANDLCAKLEAAGLKIWYSGKELGVGDSIDKTIQNGLNRSRYGIVIFSPTYLAKNWTIREFYTLLAKEIEEHKVILPVLYNITLDDLKNKDLLMADRFAVNADKGMDFVAERLVKEIKKSNVARISKRPWLSKIGFLLLLSLLTNVALISKNTFSSPVPPEVLSQTFQPVQDENTFIRAEEFFGEVQGMFSQMNQCTCDREQQPARGGENRSTVQNHIGGGGSVRETGLAKKMTMAVIFQMETGGNTPQKEEKLNTISLPAENEPFIRVKSRDISPSQQKANCLHTAALTE